MAKDDQFVDEVEESSGDGMATMLVVLTTLVLVAGIVLVQMALKEYGRGMLAG